MDKSSPQAVTLKSHWCLVDADDVLPESGEVFVIVGPLEDWPHQRPLGIEGTFFLTRPEVPNEDGLGLFTALVGSGGKSHNVPANVQKV